MKRKERSRKLKGQREREIISVASDMFAKNGYHLTDLEVVADKIGIGKGTIYRYFSSKQSLFTAVLEKFMRKLADEITGANIESIRNPVERLKVIIRKHMEFFENNFQLIELFIHYRSECKDKFKPLYLKNYSKCLRRAEALIRECIDQGFMKNIPPRATTNILMDMFDGMIFSTFLGGNKKTFREKGKYLEEVFINNLLLIKK